MGTSASVNAECVQEHRSFSQRRASIGANIAEGCDKRGNGEFQRFLQIASGSASELDYHLLLARDLNFLRADEYKKLTQDLLQMRRMLTSLLQKVNTERQEAKC